MDNTRHFIIQRVYFGAMPSRQLDSLSKHINNIFNDENEQACLKLSEGVEDSLVNWEGCWPRTLFLCNLVMDPMERKQL
jgi:hypothetical protein